MNKFFHHIFLLILVISLFSIPKVSADTSIIITEDEIKDYNNLSTIKSIAEQYINDNSNLSNNYWIQRTGSWVFINIYLSSFDITTVKATTNRVDNRIANSMYIVRLSGSNYSNPTLFTSSERFTQNVTNSTSYIIYSTFPIYWVDTSYLVDVTFLDYTFTMPISENLQYKTLYDIYDDYYSTPADNYPILTDFFSLTIDRIEYLLTEFSSNYIYLTVICTFIFITIIYFIKRRFT